MTDLSKSAVVKQLTEYELNRNQLEAIILDALKVTGTIENCEVDFYLDDTYTVVSAKISVEKRTL